MYSFSCTSYNSYLVNHCLDHWDLGCLDWPDYGLIVFHGYFHDYFRFRWPLLNHCRQVHQTQLIDLCLSYQPSHRTLTCQILPPPQMYLWTKLVCQLPLNHLCCLKISKNFRQNVMLKKKSFCFDEKIRFL